MEYANEYDYIEIYDYAKFVIEKFVSSEESFLESDFFDSLGIDKKIFKMCVNTIKQLNGSLYKLYLAKTRVNGLKLKMYYKSTIEDLVQGMESGVLNDGTEFNVIEFVRRVPFRGEKSFIRKLSEFMLENNPIEYKAIMNYIHTFKFDKTNGFSPIDLVDLFNTKTQIGDKVLTAKDYRIIVDYLNALRVPVISKTYLEARKRYLNEDYNADTVKELNKNRVTLIP